MCRLKLVNKGEESMSFTVSKKLIEVSVDYIELEDYIQVINEENKEFFNEELIKTAKAKFKYPSDGAHASYTKDCFKENINPIG